MGEERNWFTLSLKEVLSRLKVDAATGLDSTSVQDRLQQHGPNLLKDKGGKSLLQLFLHQLNDWLIYVLLAAIVITAVMGEYIDAVIIFLVIIVNAGLGVIQERKAGKAIEALKRMSNPKALVKRAGIVQEVDATELVPGDIVLLDAGRYVPADMRLIESASLQVDESALTGESVAAEKDAETLYDGEDVFLGDRQNMVFMSTLVTNGRATAIVTGTGMNTEIGKIADILSKEQNSKTPLEKRLDQLGKMLGRIAIAICLLIILLAYFQGRDLAEMFLTAVSLAVASIPEGLAAIVAVVLSIGVTNMSKRNAIIRKLPAVETLGAVNIICSDKTGTLTKNQMTVTQLFTSEGKKDVDDAARVSLTDIEQLLAEGMVLCNDATLENGSGTGDPTEIALLDLADQLGLDRFLWRAGHPRVGEFPFDAERKLMSVVVKYGKGFRVYTKGALVSLLKNCTHRVDADGIQPFDEQSVQQFRNAGNEMSEEALRTLALAYKDVDKALPPETMERDLIFVGMVGMMDPPRDEVKDAIKAAKQAGIKTVMITGDHQKTAFAIAEQLGIAQSPEESIAARDFVMMGETEFAENVHRYSVFARVSPEHKVAIVRALKAQGNIVSMTGDGVNDAPSLSTADIGVAMGITGTDVAKNAADMILTDDNFSTIVGAIEQGRNVYSNIKKAVVFLLTCNLGEVVVMVAALLLGWQAPFIATQLLWINLLTDSLPAIALGLEKGDKDVMKDKPRALAEPLFAYGAAAQVVLGGILIGLITLAAFWYGYYEFGYSPLDAKVPEAVLRNARTLAFMTLVFTQLFFSLSVRNARKSVFAIGLFSNPWLLGAILTGICLQLLVIFVPVLREAFRLEMLDGKAWAMACALGVSVFAVMELFKLRFRTIAVSNP